MSIRKNTHDTDGDNTLQWYGTTGKNVKRRKRIKGRF